MKQRNSQVDEFLSKPKKWLPEMMFLREVMLECDLEETYKWKHPCYVYNGKNVTLIHAFKDYCGLLFFKGVLLKDEKQLLIRQTENIQEGRQMRFTSLAEIEKLKKLIKTYVSEAIELEKLGVKVSLKKVADYPVPEELDVFFQEDTKFKIAFEKLTPGRQKAYLLYFSAAKQSATRLGRIQKYRAHIFNGKGLHDR